jgi:hypothetical protein
MVLVVLTIFTACSTTGSSDGPDLTAAVPDVREYTEEEQKRALEELKACDQACPMLHVMMMDYNTLRGVLKATKAE